MPDQNRVDDSLTREQKELLKSLGMKALDCLVKIAPMPELAKEGYKVDRELSKSVKTLDQLADPPYELTSSDYSINKLAQLARYLDIETAKLARHDENWWAEVSGVNLHQKDQTTAALHLLQRQREFLLGLQECCDGLNTLAKAVMGAAYINVKAIAKMYMPSIVAIDGAVTKQTLEHLDHCANSITISLDRLENTIRGTADLQKSVDRFLSLVNSSNQRKWLDAVRQDGSAGKSQDNVR